MMKEQIHIIRQIKQVLNIVLVLAIILEILLFPTLENFYGCIMAIISYIIFSYFLRSEYIIGFPFAFLMYLSMFMYRFLPLIATLLEGKPITYGLEFPYETFGFEILLFSLSSLAFYLACSIFSGKQNYPFQRWLYNQGFFKISPAILWGMGIVGSIIRIYNFSSGDVEYGDVGGKFLIGLTYLMFAPLCLFFPKLLGVKYSNHRALWFYLGFVFIINIASNSRESIITPIATIVLLFFFHMVINNYKLSKFITPLKLLIGGGFVLICLILLSKVSLAMLHTRHIRDDVGKMELFVQTLETMQDDSLMERLEIAKERHGEKLTDYRRGWTEYYVDNFMLDRYANVRITDETLFYAKKIGYANPKMRQSLGDFVLALFPTPILNFFGAKIDKSKLEFSRGDFLYGRAFGGYRVTSHVGDGLATFGYWYFLWQTLCFFMIFCLLNFFVVKVSNGLLYAPFALMSVFDILGMFRNAQGIYTDIAYILRGFAQGVITYFIILWLIKTIVKMFNIDVEKKNYQLDKNYK